MAKKELLNRLNETQFRTSSITLMIGMYLAEPIYRSWTEDFVDMTI